MAQYKIKDAGVLERIMKFIIYEEVNNLDDIKIRKLGWAGLIVRVEDERIPKKVFNGKFNNKRPVGKRRTRWGRSPEHQGS